MSTTNGTVMKDKVCLITGATSGIGKAAALQLAQLGATVVMVGRNPQTTAAAIQEIRQQSGNEQVESMLADLSSQEQIRQLAEDFKSRYQRLDVLINNAGALMLSRRQSRRGLGESTLCRERTSASERAKPPPIRGSKLLDLAKA